MLFRSGVSLSAASRVTASLNKLNVVGIYLTPAYTRAYPNGDLASNLLGFTTTTSGGDLRGQAGIEQSYNPLLAGRDGQQEVETGTNGQPIPVATDWVRPMVPGGDVKLTILAGLQWEAQQACAQRVQLSRADVPDLPHAYRSHRAPATEVAGCPRELERRTDSGRERGARRPSHHVRRRNSQ